MTALTATNYGHPSNVQSLRLKTELWTSVFNSGQQRSVQSWLYRNSGHLACFQVSRVGGFEMQLWTLEGCPLSIYRESGPHHGVVVS
jgi:hypothetical protein